MQSLSTFFEDNKPLAFISIFVALLVLFVVLLVLRRMLFGRRLNASGGARTRQPRLGYVDAVDLDRQRQLVLIRRDNIEHLVMIGGPNDLLIESTIVRAQSLAPMTGGRDKDAAAAPGASMPLPPTVPPGMGQPSAPPLVAPPISAAGLAQGAPLVAAPYPQNGVTTPPPLAASPPPDRPQPRPVPSNPPRPTTSPGPAATPGPAPGPRGDEQAGAGSPFEGDGAVSRPAPAASRPTSVAPPARPSALPPRPVPSAPARPAPPPRPGLPPRPSLASTLPPRPLRPTGVQAVPRPDPGQAGDAPGSDTDPPSASRTEPSQTGAVTQAQPPKNLETLESLEEEMAKLLGRPAPRRDG